MFSNVYRNAALQRFAHQAISGRRGVVAKCNQGWFRQTHRDRCSTAKLGSGPINLDPLVDQIFWLTPNRAAGIVVLFQSPVRMLRQKIRPSKTQNPLHLSGSARLKIAPLFSARAKPLIFCGFCARGPKLMGPEPRACPIRRTCRSVRWSRKLNVGEVSSLPVAAPFGVGCRFFQACARYSYRDGRCNITRITCAAKPVRMA